MFVNGSDGEEQEPDTAARYFGEGSFLAWAYRKFWGVFSTPPEEMPQDTLERDIHLATGLQRGLPIVGKGMELAAEFAKDLNPIANLLEAGLGVDMITSKQLSAWGRSVKVFSNATANDAPPRNFGRAIARNFGVMFSKTPHFSASALKGSRKLRTAKAIASGYATQRSKEAEMYETYEFAVIDAMKGYWSSEVAAAATLDRETLEATSTYAENVAGNCFIQVTSKP